MKIIFVKFMRKGLRDVVISYVKKLGNKEVKEIDRSRIQENNLGTTKRL